MNYLHVRMIWWCSGAFVEGGRPKYLKFFEFEKSACFGLSQSALNSIGVHTVFPNGCEKRRFGETQPHD